jgi:L-alanine-DL-glutamate epimerase-like enolase superfamily enzyme
MRVVELQAFHVRIPLRKPFTHASYTRTSTDNVVIRCVLEDGTVGFGEGVPREYVTGETIDSAMQLLAASDLKAQLEPCIDFKAAVALAERLQLKRIRGDDRGCQGNGSRCAVELALLDAYGRKFGLPVSAVVNLIALDLLEPKPWVQYSGAITTGSLGLKLRALSFGMWLVGFRHIKVKVGIDGHDDVKRLSVIRKRAGRQMNIRVDANEAWSRHVVAERMWALKPFDVSAIEQPVRHEEIHCLLKARQQTGMAVMLDESLCSMVDAQRAVEGQLCDFFNIRLSKCGGFIPSLRLAQYAANHGLGYQLGCQIGETAILSAAGRHFASSVKNLFAVEGSYDRHLVREALGTRDLTFGRGGWARALTDPGLGVEVDPAALERVTIRSQSLL